MAVSQKNEVSVVEKLQSNEVKAALMQVLPKAMNADRFLSMAVAAAKVQAVSKYITDKMSIVLAVYNAAKMGLDLNEQLGHAYLVPFKGKVVLIPGYKGLVELVRRSGQISDIKAFIVYEKEVELNQFEYWADENGQHFKYAPYFGSAKGKPVCGVSVAWFKDSTVKPSVEVMGYDEIMKIKDAALARTPSSPWGNKMYEAEMSKKTVIRRHCKMLPISADIAVSKVIHDEESIERGVMPESDELPESLRSVLNEKAEDVVVEPEPESEQDGIEDEVLVQLNERAQGLLLKAQAKGKLKEAQLMVKKHAPDNDISKLNADQLLVICDYLEELLNK